MPGRSYGASRRHSRHALMWNVNLGALVVLVMHEERRLLPWSHKNLAAARRLHASSLDKMPCIELAVIPPPPSCSIFSFEVWTGGLPEHALRPRRHHVGRRRRAAGRGRYEGWEEIPMSHRTMRQRVRLNLIIPVQPKRFEPSDYDPTARIGHVSLALRKFIKRP